MGFRSLVSFGFLILPIAVTLSVLLGLQAFRESRGMPPPFVSHAIEMATYCQRAFGIHPPTQGLEYTCESLCPISPSPHWLVFFPDARTTPCHLGTRWAGQGLHQVPELACVRLGWDPPTDSIPDLRPLGRYLEI